MTELELYEDDTYVGRVDCDEVSAAYWGDDGAVEQFLERVDEGITEVVPADVPADFEGLRPSTTRTIDGEELRTYVVGILEQLGVDVRH